MTENEWLACDQPRAVLDHIRANASERKLRLFVVACCRSLWERIEDKRLRDVADVAERFADGKALKKELLEAKRISKEIWSNIPSENVGAFGMAAVVWDTTRDKMFTAAVDVCVAHGLSANAKPTSGGFDFGNPRQASLSMVKTLRDIFGNPFRPAAVNPAWLEWNGGTVVKLAKTIYDERRWDLMPLLGDALEDAGCDSADLLDHCRGPGPHARGCWVVDLILGKE